MKETKYIRGNYKRKYQRDINIVVYVSYEVHEQFKNLTKSLDKTMGGYLREFIHYTINNEENIKK